MSTREVSVTDMAFHLRKTFLLGLFFLISLTLYSQSWYISMYNISGTIYVYL